MKNSLFAAFGIAVAITFTACGPQAEPTWRSEGTTPQERYSVTLTTDTAEAVPYRSYKGKSVKGFTLPSASRPFIAHDLLAGYVSPFRIACGDTLYRLLAADEVYTYSVSYDRKCVPDYEVLLRDFIAQSGLVADTTVEPAMCLSIVDTDAYRASVAPFLRSTGVSIRFDSTGHWMYYTPMPEGDIRQPMHIFEIVSALRYWWGLTVVPDPSLDMIELLTTGTDFATAGLGFDEVQEMLKRKFGMQLTPADREVMVVSVRVE